MAQTSDQRQAPWSNHRQVIWLIGVLGLGFFALACVMDQFFGGLDVDGRVTPPPRGFIDWLFGGVWVALSTYYIVLAHRGWSRHMWVIGVAVHSLYLAAIVLLLALLGTGTWAGSFVSALILLAGPTAWALYARRKKFSSTVL